MPTQTKFSKWLYIIVVIIFSASSAGLWFFRQGSQKPVMVSFREANVPYKEHVGTVGARTSLKLPDGAAVILNGGTRLLVPENFGQTHTVILDGEAFFDAPDGLKVVTNILTVTTEQGAFRIRCFEKQQGATAYLRTGKIVVTKSYHSSTDNNPEELGQGGMVLANKEIDLMEKETYEPQELETWLSGVLEIKNMPFFNAVRVLEDWYGVVIEVDGGSHGNVSGRFEGKTLEEVLRELKVDYKIKGDKVVIK